MERQPPVPRGIDLTPELLSSQGRALRGLARSLLGDAHAAEDVEQETWLACLRHPGAVPVRLQAWLGTVAKRLALRRKRGDERRHVREERAAPAESTTESVEARGLEREEALRTVTQALLGLEEPYKGALLLRYYEDRSPSEIAAELGLPLATVKSRLARGLEKLRLRLEPEFGGDAVRRQRALVLLAGLRPHVAVPHHSPQAPAGAAPSLATLGAISMQLKLGTALTLALLAGAAAYFLQREASRERAPLATPAARTVAAGEPLLAAPATAEVDSAAAGATREALAPESVTPTADETAPLPELPSEPGFLYRIEGQVRDARDLPLAGARVRMAPRLFPLNEVATSDDEGRFTVELEARRATLDLAFTVDDRRGNALGLRELHLVAGRTMLVDVGLGSEPQVIKLVLGTSLSGGEFRIASDLDAFDSTPAALRTAQGRIVFVDPQPQARCQREVELATEELTEVEKEIDFSTITVEGGTFQLSFAGGDGAFFFGGLDSAETPESETASGGRVSGTLRDANGAPLAGVEVGWGPPGKTLTATVQSDEHGAFVLEGLPAGELRLHAGGGDHGRARERITLAAGEERAWNPLLERGDEIKGRVRLANGDVFANLRIELWSSSTDSLWCDATLTNEDGRFAFPNVPAGPLELHVYNSTAKPELVFPVRVLGPVFGRDDVGDIVLTPGDSGGHALSVRLVDARTEPLNGAELRLWHVATGRGRTVNGPDEEGRYRQTGLPTGEYRVEAGGMLGWRSLGTVLVEEDMDLGQERFGEPGLAHLAAESPDGAVALRTVLWSAHPDVFAQADARSVLAGSAPTTDQWVGLRAGDYVLGAAAGHGKRAEFPLAIEPAMASALSLRIAGGAVAAEPGASEPLLGDDALTSEQRALSCAGCHTGG